MAITECFTFKTEATNEFARVTGWTAATVEDEPKVNCGSDMENFIEYLKNHKTSRYLSHNLKVDGVFILDYLMRKGWEITDNATPRAGQIRTIITDTGEFFALRFGLYVGKRKIKVYDIWDSSKLIPRKADEIAEDFGIQGKSEIEALAIAVNELYKAGLNRMTIASCAMAWYKNSVGSAKAFDRAFPSSTEYDADVRGAYSGGWCFMNYNFRDVDIEDGEIVLDVNSLFPYVLREMELPYGTPQHFDGWYEENEDYPLYIQMVKVDCRLKEGKLPCIKVGGSIGQIGTDYLIDTEGEPVFLYLTKPEMELFTENYEVYDMDCLGGWMFQSRKGMFNGYIDYWMGIKAYATKTKNKSLRMIAKLMLNALYGKFGLIPDTRVKKPVFIDNMISYEIHDESRNGVYLPVACFVTAYARGIIVRAAQNHIDRFLYSDTDSLHLIGTEIPDDLEIDDTKIGAFKVEMIAAKARYLSPKVYAQVDAETGELKITAAGLPKEARHNIVLDEFHRGLVLPGRTTYHVVPGGVLPLPRYFTL